MDDKVRAAERAWRLDPSDVAACDRAVAAYARAKRRPPADLAAHAIKNKLAGTGLELGPPLSEKALKAWEKQHRARLPEEYRQFLLVVGDGGRGPGPGDIWPLREEDLAAQTAGEQSRGYAHVLKKELQSPFPLTARWRAPRSFDWEDTELYDRTFEPLELGKLQISASLILIVKGPAAGQVWYWGVPDRVEPRAPDFISWYDAWLDEWLAKRAGRLAQRSSKPRPPPKKRAVGTKSVRRKRARRPTP